MDVPDDTIAIHATAPEQEDTAQLIQSPGSINKNTKRQVRKKQAVGKTKNRSTIEIIRTNSKQSPLLSLPGEIRDKILRFLLGDKCVHIMLQSIVESEFYRSQLYSSDWSRTFSPGKGPKGDQFYHSVCEVSPGAVSSASLAALETEETLSGGTTHLTCTKSFHNIEASDSDDHKSEPTEKSGIQRYRLDLAIMGVCRQIYEESSYVMWTSNAFCFQEPYTLKSFMAKLNPSQKRKINNVHLLAWTNPHPYNHPDISNTIPFKVIDDLRSVKTLYIQLIYSSDSGHTASHQWDLPIRNALSAFHRLEKLPLLDVTVYIKHEKSKDHDLEPSFDLLTPSERVEIASELRSRLLDPDGAEKAQESRERNRVVPEPWTKARAQGDLEKTRKFVEKRLDRSDRAVEEARELKKKLRAFKERTANQSELQEYEWCERELLRLQNWEARRQADERPRWEEVLRKKEALTERRIAKWEESSARHPDADDQTS